MTLYEDLKERLYFLNNNWETLSGMWDAVELITKALNNGQWDTIYPLIEDEYDEIVGMFFFCLCRVEHPESYPIRVRAVLRGLFSDSYTERDYAVQALGTWDDPAHIPALQNAIALETVPYLINDMNTTLNELQATASDRSKQS